MWEWLKTTLAGLSGLVADGFKLLSPLVAVGALLDWVVNSWYAEIVAFAKSALAPALANLGVDLSPSGQFVGMVAKINLVVPISEYWQMLLVYLSLAAVVLVVKWLRNLLPFFS